MGSCLSLHSGNASNIIESGIVSPSSAEYAASQNPLNGFSGLAQPTNISAPLTVVDHKTVAPEITPVKNIGVCEVVVEQPLIPQKDSEVELPLGDIHDRHGQQIISLPDEQRKLVSMPQDSQTSVYSNSPSPESAAASVFPALPQSVQFSSPTITPSGNVLMQLSRETILRNRMGPGALPPMVKPPATQSPEDQPNPLDASGNQSRAAAPQNAADDNASAVPPLVVSQGSLGMDAIDDSGAFDRANSVAVVTAAAAGCPSILGASGAPTGTLTTVTDSFLTGCGLGLNGAVSGALGPAVMSPVVSALTTGASGGNGSELGGTLRGLGVEATLSEMQQMALIGSGGGGCVYSGRWRGVTAAIKFIVSSTDDQLVRSQREALLSRLASHPHVVQTYAISVTQLTEQMFEVSEAARADVRHCGLADPNISHDVLAGLASGSWIRNEVQNAFHGNGGVPGLMSSAGVPVSTIHEGRVGSSAGSVSASVGLKSGRTLQNAGLMPPRNPATGGGVAATSETQSEGQESNSSASRTRGQEAEGATGGLGHGAAVATQQTAFAGATGPNSTAPSCHTSATSSGLDPVNGLLLQGAFHGAIPPSCSATVLASLAMGTYASPPASAGTRSAAEMQASPSQPPNSSGGGGAGAGAGSGSHHTSGMAIEAAANREQEAEGGERRPPANPMADSFYSSYVRDHLVRAKYSMNEVLRHMGAHAGQFLTMVVMEYCDGGSLLAALKEGPFHRETTSWSPRMLLRSTIRTALDVAHGMQHLHISGLVHGDLKPGNVLLKGSNQDKRTFVAKVSDLGIAHPLGTAEEMAIDDGQIGSVAYMAPEVFRGRIMKASDVYSFGVLLWQLTCGTGAAPYEGAHPIAIALGVSEGKMTLRWPPGAFRPLQQLGELCLHVDPACRPSFKSVVGALEKLERHMQRLAAAATAGSGGSSTTAAGLGGSGISIVSPASSQNAIGSLPSSLSGPALLGSPAISAK